MSAMRVIIVILIPPYPGFQPEILPKDSLEFLIVIPTPWKNEANFDDLAVRNIWVSELDGLRGRMWTVSYCCFRTESRELGNSGRILE
ncbi:hypothetical protein VNO77_16530 [Canavalia gladiata]|uniref:Uncharacterized protein n=1 Tax=Canavalia gladiata TaxID=3824 RepID=A0AAN9M1C5_CANGL